MLFRSRRPLDISTKHDTCREPLWMVVDSKTRFPHSTSTWTLLLSSWMLQVEVSPMFVFTVMFVFGERSPLLWAFPKLPVQQVCHHQWSISTLLWRNFQNVSVSSTGLHFVELEIFNWINSLFINWRTEKLQTGDLSWKIKPVGSSRKQSHIPNHIPPWDSTRTHLRYIDP